MKTILSLILLIGLGACSSLVPAPVLTPPPKPGSGAPVIGGTAVMLPTPVSTVIPDMEFDQNTDIQQLMLASHTRWQNLWADGQIVFYSPDGSNTPLQTIRVQLWLSQPGATRVLIGDAGGSPVEQTASDGAYFKGLDGIIQPISDYILQPFTPPAFTSDTVYPHPMTGLLNTPLSDLVFPTALAQRGGDYTIIGKEIYLGREAYSVEWRRESGGPVVDRFLVDTLTGVLLRQQNFSKSGGGALNTQLYLDDVVFDGELAEKTFYLGLPLPSSFAANSNDLPAGQP